MPYLIYVENEVEFANVLKALVQSFYKDLKAGNENCRALLVYDEIFGEKNYLNEIQDSQFAF